MTGEIKKLPGTDLIGWTCDIFWRSDPANLPLKMRGSDHCCIQNAAYDPAVRAHTVIEGVDYYPPRFAAAWMSVIRFPHRGFGQGNLPESAHKID